MRHRWLLVLGIASCSREFSLVAVDVDEVPLVEMEVPPDALPPGIAEPPAPRASAACPVPVPDHVDLETVVWGEEDVHFYVPDPSWALAVALASRELSRLDDVEVSPSFVLATALKESFLGCDLQVAPDAHHDAHYRVSHASFHDGCFQIESTTAFTELCRMFPDAVDCAGATHGDVIASTRQEELGRTNFESSALALAYYDAFAWGMLTVHDDDPTGFVDAAADPLAQEKLLALSYNRGAWSSTLARALADCVDRPLEDCVTDVPHDYLVAVGGYTTELEAAVASGSCYDEPLTRADVARFVDAIAVLDPRADWASVHEAALDAFTVPDGSRFQVVADAVLEAIVATLPHHVHCPDGEMRDWYGQPCP